MAIPPTIAEIRTLGELLVKGVKIPARDTLRQLNVVPAPEWAGDEARAIVAPVLSHVWIKDRGLHAITPTAAFEPLLVGVWRTEVVMGCPMGFEPTTS